MKSACQGQRIYITVAAADPVEFARSAEKAVVDGDELGPVHRVPISVKDLEMTAGIRTTFGSLIYRDHVPDSACTGRGGGRP